MTKEKDLVVGFPLYNGCTLMDFAGATQVFASTDGFSPIWLAATMDPVETTESVKVQPNCHFDKRNLQIDILFVPGGGYRLADAMQDKTYLDFIKKIADAAKWRGSVCSGAFLLAAAGILKDCKATTYWSQIPTLALLEQKLNLSIPEGYPRYLLDENKKIFTGGGISSSIDLALELVLRIKGTETAEKTQLFIQYAPHPPVNSGDPSVAPESITEDARKSGTQFTILMTNAVMELLNQTKK